MPLPAARRRPLALMWPPAARWREHLCMLVVRDTRGCELEPNEQLSMFVRVLPITLAFLHRIAIEEAALRSALGSRYADYAGRTRRLVPFVY